VGKQNLRQIAPDAILKSSAHVAYPNADRDVGDRAFFVGVLKWSESPQENDGGFACEPILSTPCSPSSERQRAFAA
jgi:hypothetical protein